MSPWLVIPAAAAVAVVLGLLLRRRLLRPRRIVVGRRGILQRDLGWGWIPWEEIEGAYTPANGRSETLRVRLRVTERLARAVRARAGGTLPDSGSLEVRLELDGSGLTAVELLQKIVSQRDARLPGPR